MQMTKDSKPPLLLIGAGNDPESWEVKAVAKKFSSADAQIGEENVDYVALGYMNSHGAAYWLPRFVDYLRTDAPEDSFHFDSLLTKLANNSWSPDVRAEMSEATVKKVRDFLDWLADSVVMKGAPDLRQAEYDHAKLLWS
jgi:hypothetical protein